MDHQTAHKHQWSLAQVQEALMCIDPGMSRESRIEYVHRECERIRATLSRIPMATGGERLLDLGCYAPWIGAYVNLLGYRDIAAIACEEGEGMQRDVVRESGVTDFALSVDFLDAEVAPLPYPDNSFDVVVCCSVVEHLVLDPMHLMSEINRVTKCGGRLVLQTPNSASFGTLARVLRGRQPYSYSVYLGVAVQRHNREYTARELVTLAENGGFEVVSVETIGNMSPAWHRWMLTLLSMPAALVGCCPLRYRGERAMLLGVKTGPVVERWPTWLYEDPWFVESWYRNHGELGRRRLDEWAAVRE
jgi:SAM-dependent methyltransferase